MPRPRRLPHGGRQDHAGIRLPAKFVIHAVGPVWRGGGAGEGRLLASCYRRCLEIAREKGLGSVAFPSIGTSVYGYPIEEAARIAVGTVRESLAGSPPIDVTFCCFSSRDLTVYEKLLAR